MTATPQAVRAALAAAGVDLTNPDDRAAIVAAVAGPAGDRKFTAAEKATYATELRITGLPYRRIAELVGYAGPGPAWKAVDRVLTRLQTDSGERLRTIAVERLEAILGGGLYERARKGDVKSIDRVLKVMREQRRYIPGLEVPAGGEMPGGGGVLNVHLHLPEPVPITPVPEGELTVGAFAITTTSTPTDP